MELQPVVHFSILFILWGNIHQAHIIRNWVFPFLLDKSSLHMGLAVSKMMQTYPTVMTPGQQRSEIDAFCTQQLANYQQSSTKDIMACIYLRELWETAAGNRLTSGGATKIEGDPKLVHKIWKALQVMLDKPIKLTFAIMERANEKCDEVSPANWKKTRVPELNQKLRDIASVCRFMLEQKYPRT